MEYSYGMVGLGTMGHNLVLNMSDNGFTVSGYDKDAAKVTELNKNSTTDNLKYFSNINDFVDSLSSPKMIMLLVPAGGIVDSVIAELKPLLKKGDAIIDCGNSHFTETNKHIDLLENDGIHFMGVGISGGETGARFGPSIMPGGDEIIYNKIAPMLSAIAAKADGEPCTAYMGRKAAGHYVKMVHNGIEYALMEMIAESYQILKEVALLNNDELHDVFAKWSKGKLSSYLIDITASIFTMKDDDGKADLVDIIKDEAGQKGTGAWMSQDATNIAAPIPAIDAAVTQRIISGYRTTRLEAAALITKNKITSDIDKETLINDLEDSLYAGYVICFAQALFMLQKASDEYDYGTDVKEVIKIWRGGCIIRAELLSTIYEALQADNKFDNLLITPQFLKVLTKNETALRTVVCEAIKHAIPTPSFAASLNYFDSYFSSWLPANLIQAQRDFFGAHTYKRLDKEGTFHTQWNQTIK